MSTFARMVRKRSRSASRSIRTRCFSDLNMPEATGLETAKELRLVQRRRGLRLVALTGNDSAELRGKRWTPASMSS